jgi:hypothetical protein
MRSPRSHSCMAARASTWVTLYYLGRTWDRHRLSVSVTLPGDELIRHPQISSDHSITIQPRAQDVWPWLV